MLARSAVALSCLLLLLCAARPTLGQAVAKQPFSADEKAQLKAGKLVVRTAKERRGNTRLIGGASWQVVNLPADSVWRGLLDTSHYHKMLPQVAKAAERISQPNFRVIHIQHKTGPFTAQYDMEARIYHDRHDVTFRLDQTPGSSLGAAWGFMNVRPYGSKRSIIAYGIMADLGDGLFTGMVRSTIHEWMLKVPLTMKWFMEGSGRRLYAPKKS